MTLRRPRHGRVAGIGLACARRLAADGHRVAVTYLTSPPPEGLFGVKCDVTSGDDVDRAFAEVTDHFGEPVEILVSNAGVTRDGLLLRMSEDDFTSVIDANLTASYRVVKRAARDMLRARKGRIVLMSSVVASARLGRAGQLRGLEGRARRTRPLAGPRARVARASPSTSSPPVSSPPT